MKQQSRNKVVKSSLTITFVSKKEYTYRFIKAYGFDKGMFWMDTKDKTFKLKESEIESIKETLIRNIYKK